MSRTSPHLAISFAVTLCASCSQQGSGNAGTSAHTEAPKGSATSSVPQSTAMKETAPNVSARRGLGVISRALRASGVQITDQGTSILTANSQIEVKAHVNDSGEQGGQYVLAAEFEVLENGRSLDALHTGAVGIDASAEGALDTAIQEWGTQYGAPIGFAIASTLGAEGPPKSGDNMADLYARIQVKDLTLFHGPVGFRGNPKNPGAAASDDFLRKVGDAVAPHLGAGAGTYRSAIIQLVVDGTQVTDGECRVDGKVSPELVSDLKKLAWPAGDPSYMFKLYFVVPKARLAEHR